MAAKLIERIRVQPQGVIILEALVLALVIGLADFLTGYDVNLFVLYAIPIAFVAWFSTRPAGIAVCVFCAIAWCIADAKAGHPYANAAILTWNTTVQLGFFVFAMISVSALKFRLEENRAKLRRLERFQLLARISPVAIFRADGEGRCLFVNHRWSEMTGQSDLSAEPVRWIDSLHPDDRERVLGEWSQTRGPARDFEFEARFADGAGQVTWGYGRVAPEELDGGQCTYVGAVMDMTAHRRLEREVLEISEREQQRIGQDLHDDLCRISPPSSTRPPRPSRICAPKLSPRRKRSAR